MLRVCRLFLNNNNNIRIIETTNHCTLLRKLFDRRNYSVHKIAAMGLPLTEVVKKLQHFAPLTLAESWDNVGLLIEPDSTTTTNSILLTIDLTEDVVDEAIKLGSRLIVAYHPNIFRPLKTVTQSSWKERIITKCIKNDIGVFSPHTSWDSMQNGVNDWLGAAFKSRSSVPIIANKENANLGMGRHLTLENRISLKDAIEQVKRHVGLKHLRVGVARNKDLDSTIASVALCAGSGTSVLNGSLADLYLTGEMLHHDVLEATQKGIHVILCNHSDSERGYLKKFQENFQDEQLQVFISELDKDCLTTI